MPKRPLSASESENNSAGSASGSIHNYQFTFNCSASNSTQGSFIEADPYAEDITDSESLTDSVQAFPEEFGRTYHAYRAGSYAFPNDFMERERLELQGAALVRLFGDKLYLAPLSKKTPPKYILDIATGTGDWAIEMGDEFPHAQIIATDLSPIQPNHVPPNVNFYVEDSSQEWDYSHSFDYIHTRVTSGCWSSFKDEIAKQAFEYLAPGGYFESQEFDGFLCCDDGTLTSESPLARWFNDITVAASILDRSVVVAAKLKEYYREVGFVDVQERIFKMPMNGWPKNERLKELGRAWERNFMQGLSGFSLGLFNRAFNKSAEEIEVSLVEVRRDLSNTQVHAYMPIIVVWGRKPFPGEVPPLSPEHR